MRKLVYFIAIVSIARVSYGQNEDDVLRYSQIYFGGTARNQSMAGAMSALGGDYSNALSNPAGLARFKKSNISATLDVENPRSAANFYGNSNSYSGLAGNWSNLSYIKAYNLNPNKYSNWYGLTIGLGYNRVRSFNDRIQYTGTADSSIVHSFINQANGTPDSLLYNTFPFGAGLAWDTYAMDPEPGSSKTYITGMSAGTVLHNRQIIRKGGIGEYNFNVAGNYANKLFLGGSFNVVRINYKDSYTHTETSSAADSSWLNGLTYTGDLKVKGLGWNARVGMIFLPVDWIRIGLACQTPTWYRMTDSWTNNMTTDTDDGTISEDPSWIPRGSYDYKIKTPFRANASLGVVLKKLGSIGAEVEYVNYAGGSLASRRFSSAPYSFSLENSQIQNIYRSVLNYKFGVEGRITPQLYIRGGFAYFPSPYKSGKGNEQFPTTFYTGGLGYNFGKFYIDAALILKRGLQNYYAYDPTLNGSHATIDFKNSRYLLTLGFRIK